MQISATRINGSGQEQLFDCLQELKSATEADNNFVEVLLSIECWNRLTRHQGLSSDDAKAIIREQSLPLLKA